MEFKNILRAFKKFHMISKVFQGMQRILRDFTGVQRDFGGFIEFENLGNFEDFNEFQKNVYDFYEIPKISRNFAVFHF